MQISDLVGQYSRNVANGTEELHGAQSVQKLVSTIGDLSAGSIFEGTINSVRGGKVTLALGNGQTITARLDGKMDLQQGSSMFFQVRANDGQTIAIRPYTELGNVSNPILLNALSAAQVPAMDRTLVMVDTMMQEQPVLNEKLTAEQFLQKLGRALAQNGGFGFAGMQKLFAGKEFQTIFRSVIEKQWLLQPEELKQEHKVSGLYERLEQQLSQMEEAVRATGSTQNTFLQTASQVHGNLEFMNQMNQIYHYVQLPLKMSGQNANGELYVYANRKNLRDPDAELTAFLHLDMEQLGSTDVSVRMQNRSVRTNFYLEDDASYDLVEKHLEVLNKRLKSKGYQSSITVTHEKKDISFKENIVKKGKATVGSLHRYSFDVRA